MNLVAHLLNPIVWRLPGRAARKLFSFALAEQGSLLDLTEAARLTTSPERAALYLRHASDEARHARLFAQRSAELRAAKGLEPFGDPRADSDHLFVQLGEVGFLGFVYRGERRGRRQFEAYERYFDGRDREQAALFAGILVDERRHEAYTRELLTEVAGGEPEARAALRRVRRWQAWRLWRRAGRALTGWLYQILMVALYVAMLPLALLVRLARPPRSGWSWRQSESSSSPALTDATPAADAVAERSAPL